MRLPMPSVSASMVQVLAGTLAALCCCMGWGVETELIAPCMRFPEGISKAGLMAGLDDPRSSLISHVWKTADSMPML